MLGNGERQEAPTLEGVRPDHTNRYKWAAERLSGTVVDAACGTGYGSAILAEAGLEVRAYDNDPDAIEFAEQHFNSTPAITYTVGDLYDVVHPKNVDAVVCFEALEHLVKPEVALRRFHDMAPTLLVSVPNEDVFPHRGYAHHVRHYTQPQLEDLLNRNGWLVKEWWGQEDHVAEVEQDISGRTLIAVAERTDEPMPLPAEDLTPDEFLETLKLPGRELPESVAIVAMGATSQFYYRDACIAGGFEKLAGEVWTMNMLAGVMKAHRIFHQDDFKIQEARAEYRKDPEGIIGMMDTLRATDVPVYTSRAYEDYPSAVEYPLEWVINKLGTYYMNSTVACALCMALAMGVKRIMLYGCDFAYPQGDRHKGEKGRACVEFWLGYAAQMGVKIELPPYTTLLDTDVSRRETYYGYDTEWITLEQTEDGFNVGRVDRAPEDIPTAEEMERRYSHDSRTDTSRH
jgi:SAM-dependent methyltransferase